MSPVTTTFTSLSKRAAICLICVYLLGIGTYYVLVWQRSSGLSPEALHDAIYNPMPALSGGLLVCLMWIFWGEQIEQTKERLRARLRTSKASFLATELRPSVNAAKQLADDEKRN